MAALIYRRAFSDFHGLAMLGRGELPTIAETRRRIFIAERQTNTGRPDHSIKGYLDSRLGEPRDICELPWIVLRSLAERYLERRDGRVVVRYELFGEWHELLPFISPLAVIVALLVEEGRGPRSGADPREFLAREVGETALIGAADPGLDDLVARKGLNELHMHLNGTTELDVLWPDACSAPEAFYTELKKAGLKSPEPSAELYEQLEPGLTPLGVYQRLRAVRRVRRYLTMEFLTVPAVRPADGQPTTKKGLDGLLEASEFVRSDSDWPYPLSSALALHPASVLFAGQAYSPMVEEAAFLYTCLAALKRDPGQRVIGTGLYFNLLVLTQVARLAVQQVDETGFDQFQKYTLLGTRERIEKHYGARFRQLNVREPFWTLAHLEGRFAPKASAEETCDLIADIVEGYLNFRKCGYSRGLRSLEGPLPPCLIGCPCGNTACGGIGRPDAEFSLVAHFIKRLPNASNDRARSCRDSDLRNMLSQQARILGALIDGNATVRALLQGIDGASNELHSPPEPFAPAFRLARRAGIPRATFHAGEDFRHLLSGIRAVAEALTFLDLRSGDRIGHATALGIDPVLWLARTAPQSVLLEMDVLDDAVFAYQALVAVGGFASELPGLEKLIAVYSETLYGAECGPQLLHRAWELRCLDPLAVSVVERNLKEFGQRVTAEAVAEEARFMAATTMDKPFAAELRLVSDTVGRSGVAYTLFSQRHALDPARAGATVPIDAAIISAEALAGLQDYVLGLVNHRGVALEILPTSNLRISFYNNMSEHHIFRWLGLCGPTIMNRPTICIGSDDPGIFATNLKNEYAAIGSVLRHRFKLTSAEVTQTLEKLNDSGRVHRFGPAGMGLSNRTEVRKSVL